ncbi:MAG: hypothetical protein IJG38_07290 [Thermoguttaceae bacterium]|nr:hypothetical protein [Thermoguttaceae bacterium]MBQ6617409.1 hypothetical protein [Thermoguttaceae bacterium]
MPWRKILLANHAFVNSGQYLPSCNMLFNHIMFSEIGGSCCIRVFGGFFTESFTNHWRWAAGTVTAEF